MSFDTARSDWSASMTARIATGTLSTAIVDGAFQACDALALVVDLRGGEKEDLAGSVGQARLVQG